MYRVGQKSFEKMHLNLITSVKRLMAHPMFTKLYSPTFITPLTDTIINTYTNENYNC
jgi:hypothetical protein